MKNRIIKFRVWNIKESVWYPNNYTITQDGELILLIVTGDPLTTKLVRVNPEIYQVQQFTGLLDKNNKEIYGGDVVKFSPWKAEVSNQQDYLITSPKQVRWSLEVGGDYPFSGFTFINLDPADLEVGYMVDCMNTQFCEVIGNIFENPDLLKS